jgi:hypothetical protein
MNRQQSIKQLQLKPSFVEKLMLFLSPTFCILFAVYLFYMETYSETYARFHKHENNGLLFYFIALCLILLGIYGYYKMKNYYKLESVASDIEINKKHEIVLKVKEMLGLIGSNKNDLNSYVFINPRRWYNRGITFTVTILIDEKGFYVNVHDTGGSFPFDFGYYKNYENQVTDELLIQSSYY